MSKEQIFNTVMEAAEGARMRAENRGWDLSEQYRCSNEAAQACLADHGFESLADLCAD